jgi:hypothetical protein
VWSEIDVGVIEDLLLHWQQEPPVEALFAAFVGYRPPSRLGQSSRRSAEANEKVRQFVSMFPSGEIRAGPITSK